MTTGQEMKDNGGEHPSGERGEYVAPTNVTRRVFVALRATFQNTALEQPARFIFRWAILRPYRLFQRIWGFASRIFLRLVYFLYRWLVSRPFSYAGQLAIVLYRLPKKLVQRPSVPLKKWVPQLYSFLRKSALGFYIVLRQRVRKLYSFTRLKLYEFLKQWALKLYEFLKQRALMLYKFLKQWALMLYKFLKQWVLRPYIIALHWAALLKTVPAESLETTCEIAQRPVHGLTSGAKTAWIFSLTGVSNEPRVVRQAQALHSDGWNVVVIGHQGHSVTPDFWFFVRLPTQIRGSTAGFFFNRLIRVGSLRLLQILPKAFSGILGRAVYNHYDQWKYLRKEIAKLDSRADLPAPSLIAAHDYQTCRMAYDAAKRHACEFVVDCHEYSAGQYMNDPIWVSDMRPVICAVQDYYLSRAAAVTTVCDGIAGHLNDEQTLRRRVTVVRSVPQYCEQQYRPVGDEIVLLYHGDVSYVRGLHKAIKSMPLWRTEFRLLIRGGGDLEYMRYLRELVSDLNLTDRVEMVPPVPFEEIVPAANKADVGYFVHKDLSPQKKYVLPNKFFEYIMGGLAMCVNDLPEMARLVHQFELGQLVDDYDEEAIARAVNSLTREKINDCKKKSLIAAQTLNWESEQKEMLNLYNSIAS